MIYSSFRTCFIHAIHQPHPPTHTPPPGGYYMIQLRPKLRLFALNTNLYYTNNKLTQNMTDPAGQLTWMEEQLRDARVNNQKVSDGENSPYGLVLKKSFSCVFFSKISAISTHRAMTFWQSEYFYFQKMQEKNNLRKNSHSNKKKTFSNFVYTRQLFLSARFRPRQTKKEVLTCFFFLVPRFSQCFYPYRWYAH